MRLMRCFVLVLLALLCAVGASGQTPFGSAESAPMPTSLDEAVVVVTVGDLNGLLENVGSLIQQFNPMMTGQMLKGQVGAFFEDPMFEGFPPGSGATFLVFPSAGEPFLVGYIEVAPSKIDSYLAAIKKQGDEAIKADGLIVLGDNASHLALGQKFAAQVKQQYLSGQGKPSLKAVLNMDKLVAFVEPLAVNNFFPMMANQAKMMAQAQAGAPGAVGQPTAAQMETQMKILEAEVRGLLNVSKQVKTVDLEILVNQSGVRIEEGIHAKTGSDLARFFESRSAPVSSLTALLPAKGALRGVMSYNTAALENLVKKEAEVLFNQMQTTGPDRKLIQDWIDMTFGIYAGGYAADMMTPGDSLLGGSMIYTVKDPTEALKMMESMSEKMKGMLKMYEDMGMPMSIDFQKNVGKHKDVDIHRFSLDIDMSSAGPEAERMMKVMMGERMSYDVAIIDKTMVYTMGDNKIEEMIDAVKNKSHPGNLPLKAQQVYGPKAMAYADIRVPELASRIVSVVQKFNPAMGSQAAGFVGLLQGAAPITMAGFWSDGTSARFSVDIPSGLMIKVSQAVMMGIMTAQQPGGPGAGPPPARRQPPRGGGNPANPF